MRLLWQKIRLWGLAHPYWSLALLTIVSLAPFLFKPFNFDDPLFLWIAHQIRAHPGNPYGFDVNWYGVVQPMWNTTQNPPLTSYYLAAMSTVLGWSEPAMHLALLPAAIATVLGTYRLAQRLCTRPLLAAAITLLTPVFLVSSTTVMCDVLMLALWIWAVIFWIEGLDQDKFVYLAVSGALMGLAALTKYFGMCLIPLLFAYAVLRVKKPGAYLAALLIPILALVAYQLATQKLYGHGLLTNAGTYAADVRKAQGFTNGLLCLTSLAFTGGCLATMVFFGTLIWRGRMLLFVSALALMIGVLAVTKGPLPAHYQFSTFPSPLLLKLQTILWIAGGISMIALLVCEIMKRRDPLSWLLIFWGVGTLVFVAFINWTVNGRSILPLAPVMSILVTRRLDEASLSKPWQFAGVKICLLAGALVSFLVVQGDYRTAMEVRALTADIGQQFAPREKLWFQGHWGFQYYMQTLGFRPCDLECAMLKPGDYLALPVNNAGVRKPDDQTFQFQTAVVRQTASLVTTWNEFGGNFYATVQCPLPFVFGKMVPEAVAIYRRNTGEGSSPVQP